MRETTAQITIATVQILFIDLQPEMVAGSITNPAKAVIPGAVALAKLGTLIKAPMYVSVAPVTDGDSALVPDLARALSGVTARIRDTVDVLGDMAMRTAIAEPGRADLIICGLISEAAVLISCCSAIKAGYRVHVPVDACGGTSTRTEEVAFRSMESLGAHTCSVATLVAELSPQLTSPLGKEMMSILSLA